MFKTGMSVKLTIPFVRSADTTQELKVHSVKKGVVYLTDASLVNQSGLMFNQQGKEINDNMGFNICQISKLK